MKEVNVSQYLEWLGDGKDFVKIRLDLSRQGYSEEEIGSIIKIVDDLHLQSQLAEVKQSKMRSFRIAGIILVCVSLFMLLYQVIVLRAISFIILYFNLAMLSGGGALIAYARNNKTFSVIKHNRLRSRLSRRF